MIGVIVAAHGDLASALLRSAESIVGPIPGVASVDVYDSDTRQTIEAKIEAALEKVGGEGKVLFLTDIFGGSASNLACGFRDRYDLRVLTGVNLPMLLEVATHRDEEDLGKLAQRVERTGKVAVFEAAGMLRKG